MNGLSKDIRLVAVVAVGVAVAGYLMYQFRQNPIVNQARNGFDTGVL